MLDNIKTEYFTIFLFSYLDERQKLKIIKHNKRMQKKLDISITINYKFFSGKYAIYESNGIVKEYEGESDILMFEGEYLNGERNGKGKEYYSKGTLLFEGEYLNGKRNGFGREYDYKGELKFKSEYLNGKKNGKGKKYLGQYLDFEGEYLNDKEWIGNKYGYRGEIDYTLKNNINGAGIEYTDFGKKKFEGQYLNGKRHGPGIEYYKSGNKLFEGEYYFDLKWTGKGYDSSNNIVYNLINGKGLVKEYDENTTLKFEGKFLNGKRNGEGKEYCYKTIEFEGEYLNGMRNGFGKEYDF